MEAEAEGGRRCGIEALGSDQLVSVLQFLPASAIICFGLTCRRFYDVVSLDSLWSRICRRDWGEAVVDVWPKCRRRGKPSWKQLYCDMLFCGAVAWHPVGQGDDVPVHRASHSLNLVDGQVVLFGGGCEGGRDLDDTWVASLPPNVLDGVQWRRASSSRAPPSRFGHSCVVVDDELVLFGGINDSGMRHSDTWVNRLHLGQRTWQLLQVSQSPPARGAHASCYAGAKSVIVFGGIRPDGVRLEDTWILDVSQETPTWQELVTDVSPPARSGHTISWLGGRRIILFGGRGIKFEVLNDVWLLDLEAERLSWVELRAAEVPCEAPSPRAGHSASLIFGNRLLVFGGEDDKRLRKADVWVLDPAAGVPAGRPSTSACAAAARVAADRCTSTKYTRRFWKKLKLRGQAPGRRSFHAACSLDSGHGVLSFGGMVDANTPLSPGLVFSSELYFLQLIP